MVRRLIASLLIVASVLAGGLAFAPASSALDLKCQSVNSGQCNLVKSSGLEANIWTIISFVLGLLGGIAVIVIIIGGFMYVTSSGDSSKVSAAKNTILYAVIGLVVAMLSVAIIAFVNGFF